MRGSTFTRRNTTDNVGPIFHHLFRMERSFFAGQSLNYQARVFIDQYTHDLSLNLFPLSLNECALYLDLCTLFQSSHSQLSQQSTTSKVQSSKFTIRLFDSINLITKVQIALRKSVQSLSNQISPGCERPSLLQLLVRRAS